MKTVENLLVELQDELHYHQYPSDKKGKIFKEEHLKGDYFPLHMVKMVVGRYVSQFNPAPLSEQKEEFKYRIGRSSGTVILTTNGQTEVGRIHDAELAVKVCQYLNTL